MANTPRNAVIIGLSLGLLSPLSPAHASLSKTDVSPGLSRYRDALLAIPDHRQLDGFINFYEKKWSQPNQEMTPDVQFFAAQLSLLKPFQGIFYRLKKIVEQEKVVQTGGVSALKAIAARLRILLPDGKWKQGFDYVTIPTMSTGGQFANMGEFQAYLLTEVAPVWKKNIERLESTYAQAAGQKLVWDNRIFYGGESFQDGLDQFRQFGQAEIAATLSNLYLAMQAIAVFCAYDQTDFLAVSNKLGALAGIHSIGFLNNSEPGISAKERTDVLKKFPNFLTLRPNGAALMQSALQSLQKAVEYAQLSWAHTQDLKDDPYLAIDVSLLQGMRVKRGVELGLAQMKEMVTSRTAIKSAFTGETTVVNLPAFFSFPPQDLKALLPTAFDNSDEYKSFVNRNGNERKYRNYYRGSAIGWNSSQWTTLVPSANGKGPEYMGEALKILSEGWGSQLLAVSVGALTL